MSKESLSDQSLSDQSLLNKESLPIHHCVKIKNHSQNKEALSNSSLSHPPMLCPMPQDHFHMVVQHHHQWYGDGFRLKQGGFGVDVRHEQTFLVAVIDHDYRRRPDPLCVHDFVVEVAVPSFHHHNGVLVPSVV